MEYFPLWEDWRPFVQSGSRHWTLPSNVQFQQQQQWRRRMNLACSSRSQVRKREDVALSCGLAARGEQHLLERSHLHAEEAAPSIARCAVERDHATCAGYSRYSRCWPSWPTLANLCRLMWPCYTGRKRIHQMEEMWAVESARSGPFWMNRWPPR